MTDLVQRLSEGSHPVEIALRPERSVAALKESIDRGYVHVKFTNTRGGTELGIPLDRQRSNVSDADFDRGTGTINLVGELTLDYVRVRCVADVELPSLKGQGHLEPVHDQATAS